MCSKDNCCGGNCSTEGCKCEIEVSIQQPAPVREVNFEVQIPANIAEQYLKEEQPKKD